MKPKHIYILAGIFLALIAINAFQKIHSSKNSIGAAHHEEWRPFIPSDKVAKILFSKEGYAPLAIVKESSNWKVETLSGVNADAQKISELLTQVNQLQAELRAEGEDLYERFGITDKQSFRIQIFDSTGMALVDFLMGEHRAGSGIFIRLAGKTKIYFISDDLPALWGLFMGLKSAGPRPLFFVAENPLGIQIDERDTVQLMQDEKTETFSKASRWSSAAAILDAVSHLQFVGLEQGVTAKDLAVLPPTHRLRVTHPETTTLEIGFYVTDPKITEIKTVIAGKDTVFKVSRDFFESIFVPQA